VGVAMGKTCRFVVCAQGKGGETYYTRFHDKQGLDEWISKNQNKLLLEHLKIEDKKKPLLLKWILKN
jgi:hypothetical protein